MFSRGAQLSAAVLATALCFAGTSDANAQSRTREMNSAPQTREMVRVNFNAEPGTIVIRNSERRLYLITENGVAIRYRVAVGKAGKLWEGATYVNGKHAAPAWSPPAIVKRDNPNLPDVIPGGAPNNPMGAAALTLAGGEYAIHGTNNPRSVGTSASYGCFRMFNHDVVDLYSRIGVGTRVIVTR